MNSTRCPYDVRVTEDDPIWFSSEGDTFVAGSSDPAALRRLAERLHAAFHDHSLLARLITEGEMG